MRRLTLYFFCLGLVLAPHSIARAADCPDVEDAARGAILERNNNTAAAYNTTIADPEADRDDLSN